MMMHNVREADHVGVKLDPFKCELMEGDQHPVSNIAELADSIAALGQLMPALVIQQPDGRHLIAAGRQRWMACKQLKISLEAKIWVAAEEDIDLEVFARAIRIAENVARSEGPSAMDVAYQLVDIRNQRGFKNAAQIAEFMGMPEPAVKKYLSLLRGSDQLQQAARQHELGLSHVLELMRCEKTLGLPRTRKLVDRVVSGDLAVRDLIKLRDKGRPTPAKEKGAERPKRSRTLGLEEVGALLLTQAAESLPGARGYLVELVAKLNALASESAGPVAKGASAKAPRGTSAGEVAA